MLKMVNSTVLLEITNEGELAGNVDPHLVCRFQNAQSVGIRGGKYGRVINGTGEEILGHLIAVFNGGAGVLTVVEHLPQPQLLAGLHVSLRPQLVGGGVAAAKV